MRSLRRTDSDFRFAPARRVGALSHPLVAKALLASLLGLAAMAAMFALTAPAAAQWIPESPLPTGRDVRGVAAPAPGHLFVATADDSFDASGALFESTDGGVTWIARDVPASLANDLHGVFFLDAQHGWVWGNENERTTDGGATWEPMPFLGSTYAMRFHTLAFGVASGNFGVAVSRDGGATWAPSPDDLFAFSFANDTIGLGAGPGGLYRSTDGGATFALVEAGAAAAIAFLDTSTAIAIVDDVFARSTDGGATWVRGEAALGRSELVAVSANVALAWGRSGSFPDFDERILRTADGGATWNDLGEPIPAAGGIVPFAFAVPAPGVVVASDGAGGLHRSTDAGATWTPVFASPGPIPSFLASAEPAFANASSGIFGFGAGYLVATADGGATWSQLSSGAGAPLAAMTRLAGGSLVAVGEGGAVLTRAAGDARWTLRPRPTAENLVAVESTGATSAVAVDAVGTVFTTDDAGASWTASAAHPAGIAATDVRFVSALEGWIVGQSFSTSSLFHTVDGGASWTPEPDLLGTWTAIDFEGASGWIASFDGALRLTTDGGANWEAGQLPDATFVRDLEFWNGSIGYAVGSGGYAVRSADGGATWQPLPTPDAGLDFVALELLGPDALWLATTSGATLYSATGGQSWSRVDAGEAGFGSWSAVAANGTATAWVAGWGGAIRRFDGPPPPPLNRPPVASFGFVTTGLSVAFTDASTDPDGTVVSWSWEFGDDTTSSEPSPTHVFGAADTYIVRLTVTDDDGDSDAFVRFVVVQPGPGGTFGDFTEVTPLDPLWVTSQDEDFWVSAAASADVDRDGDLDLVVLGYYVVYNESATDRLVLMRNDGPSAGESWSFSYVELPLGDLTAGASDLAFGDVDGDGDEDLVIGSDGATALYRNDEGALVPTSTVLPGYWEDNDQADFDLRSISWADFDNDGDLDLLLPSIWDSENFEFRTALLRNDGADGAGGFLFTEVEAGLAPTAHAQTQWADADGDEDLDLLLVNLAPLTGESFVRIYRNDGPGGAGGFVAEDPIGTVAVEHGEVQWGDADGDGDLDLLVAGNVREADDTYDTVLRLYRNDGATYEPIELIDCVFCEGWFDLTAAAWADYDSDGDVDILLAGTYNSGSQIEGRAKIYDAVGGGYVDSGNQLPAPRSMGFSGGSFGWLDLDGEGDLDYFVAGAYFVPGGNGLIETQMHLYVNDASGTNTAPTAPGTPQAIANGDGSVDLFWTPAVDDSTPAAALTYDVRIYRGGSPVDPGHRNPEPGRIADSAAWNLAGLADGEYAWTVAAIDSAYNAGPVAGGTFRVGTPPVPVFVDGFEAGGTGAWSATAP